MAVADGRKKWSVDDEIATLRRGFVADLYLRRGAFWNTVGLIRSSFHIEPEIAIPPFAPAGPFRPKVHRFVGSPSENTWLIPTRDFHDLVNQQLAGCMDLEAWKSWWDEFFTACVCFDPPEDQLLDFAKRFEEGVDVGLKRFITPSSEHGLPGTKTLFSSPTIRLMAHPLTSNEVTFAYFGDLLHQLTNRLRNQGIDLHEEIKAVTTDADFLARHKENEDFLRTTQRPYICVGPFTTDKEVREAAKEIREFSGLHKTGGHPRVDDLVPLQCAVWKDYFEMSEKEIAIRLGVSIQAKPGQSQKSETVRRHTLRGRRLIEEAQRRWAEEQGFEDP